MKLAYSRLPDIMKTWLILIYLAISVIPNFSQKVMYVRTNEAGTPLPIQDAETEEAEEKRTIITHNQDSEKGVMSWLWSFVKKKPDRTEDPRHQRAMDTKSKNSTKGMLARLWSFMSKKPERTEDPEHQRAVETEDSKKGMLAQFWSFVQKKTGRTEDPEHQRVMETERKDSKKGMLARLWSFMSKDSSDGKKMETEPLPPSQAPGIPSQEPSTKYQGAIKWDSVTLDIQPRKFLKFHVNQGDAPADVDLKSKNISCTGNERRTEEMHSSSLHHDHTVSLHSQDTSANKKEDGTGKHLSTWTEKEEPNKENNEGEDEAGEKMDDSFTNADKELSATEPPPRDSTAAEPLAITEKATSIAPRRNPWAACNHSTPEMEGKVAAALTKFALNFYEKAIEFEKDTNIVFSPISISVILSNLLLGACDGTKVHLEKLLSYPEDVTCVHAALKNLQKSEALASVSAIYFQPTFNLNDEFRRLSDKFYQSRIQHLSNDSHQDVIDINAWVSKNTDHKIKKILDDLDPNVQMVLLNAIFLRAKWKTMFKKHTVMEEFYRPGLPTIAVPMMTSKKYPMASFVDNSLQAKVGQLQLSHNMSMIIIMPLSLSQNLSEVEKRLDADVLMAVMSKLESMPFRPTIVTLPKFKVASSQDLISIVQRLDFDIFYYSNLCGISEDEEVQVTSAQHRAVLEINEEGVEAAAATVTSLARTANFFSVQQPFIFMVSKNNEFPVFLGRIHNPKAP